MNVQQSRFDAPAGFSANRPDLAHMPERPIGPIRAVPASRLLRAPDGREFVVEPLVMQVLLALAEAEGDVHRHRVAARFLRQQRQLGAVGQALVLLSRRNKGL